MAANLFFSVPPLGARILSLDIIRVIISWNSRWSVHLYLEKRTRPFFLRVTAVKNRALSDSTCRDTQRDGKRHDAGFNVSQHKDVKDMRVPEEPRCDLQLRRRVSLGDYITWGPWNISRLRSARTKLHFNRRRALPFAAFATILPLATAIQSLSVALLWPFIYLHRGTSRAKLRGRSRTIFVEVPTFERGEARPPVV